MIVDKKCFACGSVALLVLLTAAIIQLSPPETPESSPQFYYRNFFLVLDLMEEEIFKKTPDSKKILIENLYTMKRYTEIEIWEKYGDNL